MASPEELLGFAEQNKLASGVARRAAIGRAYYAAFHALQPSIASMATDQDRGTHGCAHHSFVLRCLRRWASDHPDRSLAMRHGAGAIKCYHLMAACKDAREQSDYDLRPSAEPTAMETVNIVGKAGRIMKYASAFCR